LADALQQRWQQHTHCPLQLVAGDYWLAGTVAINLSPRASAIPDADLSLVPWADQARMQQQGVLLIWQTQDSHWQSALPQAGQWDAEGEFSLNWPRLPEQAPLSISWRLWLPEADCSR
jgi:hypothetical protein